MHSTRPVSSIGYRLFVLILIGVAGAGLWAAHEMDTHGHVITGMSNQIVWGIPHVFAIVLILAASGVLNIATMGTVFGREPYKPFGRLSGLIALALLSGGLAILVLDLGRPDRLVVAITHYNFRSIFAWNVFLYTGFMAVIAVYLWTLMEKRANRHAYGVGITALGWRFVLTAGTGSIFGFLVAREAYDSALLAPIFILESLNCGLAVFIITVMVLERGEHGLLGQDLLRSLKNLLGIFAAVTLFLIAIFHLTGLYAAEHAGFERFALRDAPVYSGLFWAGKIGIGAALPMLICLSPAARISRPWLFTAAASTIVGTFAWLYVTIIGGQAYPLNIFPGHELLQSGYQGDAFGTYRPAAVEVALGLGGTALALLTLVGGLRVLPFMPIGHRS